MRIIIISIAIIFVLILMVWLYNIMRHERKLKRIMRENKK